MITAEEATALLTKHHALVKESKQHAPDVWSIEWIFVWNVIAALEAIKNGETKCEHFAFKVHKIAIKEILHNYFFREFNTPRYRWFHEYTSQSLKNIYQNLLVSKPKQRGHWKPILDFIEDVEATVYKITLYKAQGGELAVKFACKRHRDRFINLIGKLDISVFENNQDTLFVPAEIDGLYLVANFYNYAQREKFVKYLELGKESGEGSNSILFGSQEVPMLAGRKNDGKLGFHDYALRYARDDKEKMCMFAIISTNQMLELQGMARYKAHYYLLQGKEDYLYYQAIGQSSWEKLSICNNSASLGALKKIWQRSNKVEIELTDEIQKHIFLMTAHRHTKRDHVVLTMPKNLQSYLQKSFHLSIKSETYANINSASLAFFQIKQAIQHKQHSPTKAFMLPKIFWDNQDFFAKEEILALILVYIASHQDFHEIPCLEDSGKTPLRPESKALLMELAQDSLICSNLSMI